MLFMVPLGPPSARPVAQALQLPFEYYLILLINPRRACAERVTVVVSCVCVCVSVCLYVCPNAILAVRAIRS